MYTDLCLALTYKEFHGSQTQRPRRSGRHLKYPKHMKYKKIEKSDASIKWNVYTLSKASNYFGLSWLYLLYCQTCPHLWLRAVTHCWVSSLDFASMQKVWAPRMKYQAAGFSRSFPAETPFRMTLKDWSQVLSAPVGTSLRPQFPKI